MRCGLFESIRKRGGGRIVMAIDIGEFDTTIFLEFTGSKRRADDRDAPCESEFPVNVAGPDGQALFTGFFGRMDMLLFDMFSNPVGRQQYLVCGNTQIPPVQLVTTLAQVGKIILAIRIMPL